MEAEQAIVGLGQGTNKSGLIMYFMKQLQKDSIIQVEGDWRLSGLLWICLSLGELNIPQNSRWYEGIELLLSPL